MVPFVYLASACRSLQCLISDLTQGGRGGLLFRFACSVVLWGRRGAADKCHWPVWGALAVFRPHWVCPHSRVWVLSRLHCSGSRLLYRERALSCVHFPGPSRSGSGSRVLHKDADFGPAFCAFPGLSSSGSQELDEHTLARCRAPSPLHGPSFSFCVLRSGEPCVSSGELISGCDPPSGCQPSRISGSLWLETGSLFAVW